MTALPFSNHVRIVSMQELQKKKKISILCLFIKVQAVQTELRFPSGKELNWKIFVHADVKGQVWQSHSPICSYIQSQ